MSGHEREWDRRQVLAGAAALAACPMIVAEASAAAAPRGLRQQDFDGGWRFHQGAGKGFEAPGLDDAAWRGVDLPHDWSIEDLPAAGPTVIGPFDRKAAGSKDTGFTVGGEGWYRKTFTVAAPPGAHVEIVFDGVYMDADFWINGHHLGTHPNGYVPVAYDLTPFLAASGSNVLAVRVRNLGRNSRWYSGSGIYRHVRLDIWPSPLRVARWGVGVTTRRVTAAGAELDIATRVEGLPAGATLKSRVTDNRGRTLWSEERPAAGKVLQAARIRAPRLWSPDTPALYMLHTELQRDGVTLDTCETPFGIRIVSFDAATGMMLNGAPIKLRGGCVHHDNGLLGAMAFDAAEERKVRLMKARGFNAVRPSHNPFSPAFLAACDRHGLMVVAETFDAWHAPKLPDDYSMHFDAQWESDLTTMVLSARNHPSIIMWSIGNEIPDRNLPSGVEIQWRLANTVHRLDPTRPVTAAINDFAGRPVIATPKSAGKALAGVPTETSVVFLDVVGYNYKLRKYESDHAKFPRRILYGSESFAKDIFATWDLIERSPYVIGDFVWTAIDYLGEAGLGGANIVAEKYANAPAMLGGWPWVVSGCGDIDLIGRQKGASLARDVVWGLSPLEVAVQKPLPDGKAEAIRPWGWSDERPSWTWPGAEGKPLAVRVYTAGDRVELRLNGHMLETHTVARADLRHVAFKVPYAPGVLEVVAFREGRELARRTLETAGAAAAVRLEAEHAAGGAGRGDVSYVAITLVDAKGRPAGDIAADVQLEISGPAELVGFGSATPFATGSMQRPVTRTWDGRALAILRGTGKPGPVRIVAHSPGLQSDTSVLQLR